MEGKSVSQQLHYAYVGVMKQREIDHEHVCKLADIFEVQGIQWMPAHCHISVTVNQQCLTEYIKSHPNIQLQVDQPPTHAQEDYFSELNSFYKFCGSKFEIQAGMHRLHAAALLAKRRFENELDIREQPVRFIADIYDPGKLNSVDLELLRSNLAGVNKADNEGRVWQRMTNLLVSISTDDTAGAEDYKRFYTYVLGKDSTSGSNARFISLFKSHWQPHISKLLSFPAYNDDFKTSKWDTFRGCRLREPWYRRIETICHNLDFLLGGMLGHKHLDTMSLNILRKVPVPRTDGSINTCFEGTSLITKVQLTGDKGDRNRNTNLFPYMTQKEYDASKDQLLKIDRDFVFPRLQDLTRDMKDGVMSVANSLAMHISLWLCPDSMQESRNSAINSRQSLMEVLTPMTIIYRYPNHAPQTEPVEDTTLMPIKKATISLFEEEICSIAKNYRVEFTTRNSANECTLSLKSVSDDPPNVYKKRFTENAGWRAVVELVTRYYGAPKLIHRVVKGFTLQNTDIQTQFRAVDLVLTTSTNQLLKDHRVLNNPALRSRAARVEFQVLQDEMILRWQIKCTKSFIATGTNVGEERVMGHVNPGGALDSATSALEIYLQEQARRAQEDLRTDLGQYTNHSTSTLDKDEDLPLQSYRVNDSLSGNNTPHEVLPMGAQAVVSLQQITGEAGPTVTAATSVNCPLVPGSKVDHANETDNTISELGNNKCTPELDSQVQNGEIMDSMHQGLHREGSQHQATDNAGEPHNHPTTPVPERVQAYDVVYMSDTAEPATAVKPSQTGKKRKKNMTKQPLEIRRSTISERERKRHAYEPNYDQELPGTIEDRHGGDASKFTLLSDQRKLGPVILPSTTSVPRHDISRVRKRLVKD